MTHLTLEDEALTIRLISTPGGRMPIPNFRSLCAQHFDIEDWDHRPLAGVNGEHPECERCGILALGTAGPLYLLYRRGRHMETDAEI